MIFNAGLVSVFVIFLPEQQALTSTVRAGLRSGIIGRREQSEKGNYVIF